MTVWIIPYKRYSNGARALANATGYRRALDGKGIKRGDRIINWGSSQVSYDTHACDVLNDFARVQTAANKLHFFQAIGTEVRTVPWTADKGIAAGWNSNGDVVARKVLTGHSGNGIVIVPQNGELVDAPLYTKYEKGSAEYRIHVAFGEVIDVQRKIRDPDREPTDWKVRSHSNGFIFVRGSTPPSEDTTRQAVDTAKRLGLHFGAVDIIQKKDGTAYVLEINTSPGLEGQTVQSYAEAFKHAIS